MYKVGLKVLYRLFQSLVGLFLLAGVTLLSLSFKTSLPHSPIVYVGSGCGAFIAAVCYLALSFEMRDEISEETSGNSPNSP